MLGAGVAVATAGAELARGAGEPEAAAATIPVAPLAGSAAVTGAPTGEAVATWLPELSGRELCKTLTAPLALGGTMVEAAKATQAATKTAASNVR